MRASRPSSSSYLLFFIIIQTLRLPNVASGQQQPNLGTTLVDSLQHLSKADIQSLLKLYASDTAETDENVDSLVLEALSAISSTTARNAGENSFILLDGDLTAGAETINIQHQRESASANLSPVYAYAFNGSSFQAQAGKNSDHNGVNKKREIDNTKEHRNQQEYDEYHERHHRQQLPLEKLFPQILTTTVGSVRVTDSKGKQIDDQAKLTSALLNHSIHNNYESDEELDRLVFSQLPQGSKLILRTVKIVKTDEDGNEEPMGDSAVSWDVLPVNGTDDEEFEDDGTLVVKPGKGWNPRRIRKRPEYGFVVKDPLNVENIGRDEGGDDDDENENETDAAEGRSNDNDDEGGDSAVRETQAEVPANANAEASMRQPNTVMPDQYSAGSHQTTQRHQKYKHGSNEREKEKTDKYYHDQDHVNENINTKTNSDGKKVTDYEGTEKGLTDYVNAHGKAIHDERERYKNSKKKNKGRKVTGFKRVYHKEEFQRTEHFYDDEEAKRIAESYGLTDQKEKSNHGTKQDKRKYHGTKIEHTDVDKLKKEKITKDKHSKGAHHANEHTDKHKHGQKYAQHSQSHTPVKKYGSNKQSHYQQGQQQDYEHPNHNYQAQYSIPEPQIGELVQYAPAQLVGGFTASSPAFVNKLSQKSAGENRVVAHGSQIESTILPTPSPMLAKPSEMKIFFAERERKIPDEDAANKYYAPNFGPPYAKDHKLTESEVAALFASPSDNSTTIPRKLRHPHGEEGRYATNYEPNANSPPDPIPEYYSTILKTTPGLKSKRKGKRGKKLRDGTGNIVDVQQSLGAKVASEVIYQPPLQSQKSPQLLHPQLKAPGRGLFQNANGNRYSTWLPIGSESMSQSQSISTHPIQQQQQHNDSSAPPNDTSDSSNSNSNSSSSSLSNFKPSPSVPPHHTVLNQQLPHLLIAKPMPYRITRPSLNRQLAFRPYGAAVPVPANNHGPPPSHYYGTTIISQAPSTILRRIPTYSTHLMNGFVNSVTGVFGRVVGR